MKAAVLVDAWLSWRERRAVPRTPLVDYCRLGSAAPVRALPLKALPQRPTGHVRLVVVSDTHERHRDLCLPPGDVLLHCGDILVNSKYRGPASERVLADFNRWLAESPCPERVVIGGNHDTLLEGLGPERVSALLPSAVWLQDAAVTLPVAGIKVYGNAYSEGFPDNAHNDAWQGAPVVSSACQGADVVMTHSCVGPIQEAVLSRTGAPPRLWACGHLHERHGVWQEGATTFVNAAVSGRSSHRLRYPPVVVDLPLAS